MGPSEDLPQKTQSQPPISEVTPDNVPFTQLDVPEDFGHHERLGPEQWAPTVPLNASTPFPEERGLPPIGAGIDETYSVGQRLSQLRIAFAAPCDGVYCPICHIANTQLAKLHTPCPQCNRSLLRFGWV